MGFPDSEALTSAAKENPEIGRTKAVRLWTGKDSHRFPEL